MKNHEVSVISVIDLIYIRRVNCALQSTMCTRRTHTREALVSNFPNSAELRLGRHFSVDFLTHSATNQTPCILFYYVPLSNGSPRRKSGGPGRDLLDQADGPGRVVRH